VKSIKYLSILVVVGACIFMLFFLNEKEDYVEEYNFKIKELDKKVDSLQDVNDDLALKIDTLNSQISQLDQELDLKDNSINTLRNEVNIKVSSVNSFTDDELQGFFTKRYQYYSDSVRKANSTTSN
jgi:peptidoglycan hydrolase CwlO-like protein